MKAKRWLICWFVVVFAVLGFVAGLVYKVDPYFHYHKPDIEKYYYTLNNQRSQNNGISKHFDYDALITGTSMTENFKTSEMDEIFGVNSIKVSFSGGPYKEINDNLIIALEYNSNLKTILRGLDYARFMDDKDLLRNDLGAYPTYLYDNNLFNDVKYLFNKDVIFGRVYSMQQQAKEEGFTPGISSFDDYSRWQKLYTFGRKTVLPKGLQMSNVSDAIHLSDDDKKKIYANITQNVTSLADKYPDVEFYYFFTPYSAVYWSELVNEGTIYRQIEAEQYVIELILEHDNINLYSFNNRTDITTNLNNYKDKTHYGEWVNSFILKWIKEGKYQLTKDNYLDYLEQELDFYTSFNYNSLNKQEDYEGDYYAAALMNNEFNGAVPVELFESDLYDIELSQAEFFQTKSERGIGLKCVGTLKKEVTSEIGLSDYLLNYEYIGAKVRIDDLGNHNYLVFYGKKLRNHGQPTVCVYNDDNENVGQLSARYTSLDNEWHQYVIDLTKVDGGVTIVFNGGYIDDTGNKKSTFVFAGATLY